MRRSIANSARRRLSNRLILCAVVASAVWPAASHAAEPRDGGKQPAEETAVEVTWLSDYAEAMYTARQEGKMLLAYFHSPTDTLSRRFEKETLADSNVRKGLQDYVCVRLPLDTSIGSEGEKVALLKHKAFREMLGRPGVAIIDFASDSDRLNGSVVSTFPLTEELFYTPRRMSVILNLPFGTLTQRTLIYAVRIHRERPASTNGQIYSALVDAAESHSKHQARIRLQRHHQWSSRFHRISAGLPNGLAACEVCAESWPGENLVEAAIECVHSWRLSQGHWSAVRAFHPLYGYDMKRGSNGIWYSTGIFGRK